MNILDFILTCDIEKHEMKMTDMLELLREMNTLTKEGYELYPAIDISYNEMHNSYLGELLVYEYCIGETMNERKHTILSINNVIMDTGDMNAEDIE